MGVPCAATCAQSSTGPRLQVPPPGALCERLDAGDFEPVLQRVCARYVVARARARARAAQRVPRDLARDVCGAPGREALYAPPHARGPQQAAQELGLRDLGLGPGRVRARRARRRRGPGPEPRPGPGPGHVRAEHAREHDPRVAHGAHEARDLERREADRLELAQPVQDHEAGRRQRGKGRRERRAARPEQRERGRRERRRRQKGRRPDAKLAQDGRVARRALLPEVDERGLASAKDLMRRLPSNRSKQSGTADSQAMHSIEKEEEYS